MSTMARSAQARGQFQTIAPFFLDRILSPRPPTRLRDPLRSQLSDPDRGLVPLIAERYRSTIEGPHRQLRILLHGLASDHRAHYLSAQLRESLRVGADAISVALRGACGEGIDHYHAGLTAELHALLRDPRLDEYDEITVTGYSLGGLLCLRFAAETKDPRVRAVAALCPPLLLDEVQRHLDLPGQRLYRSLLLTALRAAYLKIWRNAREAGLPLAPSRSDISQIKSFKDWDETVVLSRFPFTSQAHYHAEVSMNAERLSEISFPTLIYLEEYDPMIPFSAFAPIVEPLRAGCWPQLELVVSQGGGHLGFPSKLRLLPEGDPGLAPQLERWFQEKLDRP